MTGFFIGLFKVMRYILKILYFVSFIFMVNFVVNFCKKLRLNGSKKQNNSEKIMYLDMISYENFKKLSPNKYLLYLIYSLKVFVVILFLPLILVFMLFDNKVFLRIFKQVVVILYFIFMCVFMFTLFSQNRTIISDSQVVIDIPINKNKIKTF